MNKFARFSGTPDANEREIIRELQDRGATVVVIDRPTDLVVGYLGRWTFVEVKVSRRARIRKGQQAFLNRCAIQGLPAVIMDHLDDCDRYFPIQLESDAPRFAVADELGL